MLVEQSQRYTAHHHDFLRKQDSVIEFIDDAWYIPQGGVKSIRGCRTKKLSCLFDFVVRPSPRFELLSCEEFSAFFPCGVKVWAKDKAS